MSQTPGNTEAHTERSQSYAATLSTALHGLLFVVWPSLLTIQDLLCEDGPLLANCTCRSASENKPTKSLNAFEEFDSSSSISKGTGSQKHCIEGMLEVTTLDTFLHAATDTGLEGGREEDCSYPPPPSPAPKPQTSLRFGEVVTPSPSQTPNKFGVWELPPPNLKKNKNKK